jgi:HTH-type transcriptional regulator, sugar sensing transcriptional regulator
LEELDSLESEVEERIDDLSYFGLTPLQSKVYIALVMYGPSSASTIGSSIGVNRVDIYRVLKGLEKRGIVEALLGNPAKYIAIDPQRALATLIKEAENHVAELKEQGVPLAEWLKSISKLKATSELPDQVALTHFKLKHSRQVFDTFKTLMENSQREILKVWSPAGLHLYYSERLLEYFRKASERGVMIKAVTEVRKDNLREVNEISEYVSLRHSDNLSASLRYMIVDSKQVFVNATPVPMNIHDFTALWTDNPAIVQGFCLEFARLWDSSSPLEDVRIRARS